MELVIKKTYITDEAEKEFQKEFMALCEKYGLVHVMIGYVRWHDIQQIESGFGTVGDLCYLASVFKDLGEELKERAAEG